MSHQQERGLHSDCVTVHVNAHRARRTAPPIPVGTLNQPVSIYGTPCRLLSSTSGYVVTGEGGVIVAEAPTRLLAIARAGASIRARSV